MTVSASLKSVSATKKNHPMLHTISVLVENQFVQVFAVFSEFKSLLVDPRSFEFASGDFASRGEAPIETRSENLRTLKNNKKQQHTLLQKQ